MTSQEQREPQPQQRSSHVLPPGALWRLVLVFSLVVGGLLYASVGNHPIVGGLIGLCGFGASYLTGLIDVLAGRE
jgi:hypothetical protein